MTGNVVVEGLGKAYKQYPTRWSRLLEWISPGKKSYHTLIWVIKGVSFNVVRGEAIGIIGINGAGKSTILKIIAGTTHPTTGSVLLNGSVAAILELGMGFHPDFTGRQNALMAAQLLGLSIERIRSLLPEIESFAEIGDYMDMPIRTYSSGMQVRLAFSVATAVRPDILIVDEALSVGDSYFQHKSFARIRDYKAAGTTILFVSHDLAAMRIICEKCVWIKSGLMELYGGSKDVIDAYETFVYKKEQDLEKIKVTDGILTIEEKLVKKNNKDQIDSSQESFVDLRKFEKDWGDGFATVDAISLTDSLEKPISWILGGEDVILRIRGSAIKPLSSVIVGFMVKDRLGQNLFGDNNYLFSRNDPVRMACNEQVEAKFSFAMPYLPSGLYSITVAIISGTQEDHKVHGWVDEAIFFESHNGLSLNGLVGIPMKKVEIKIFA